jgi:hypothetical protein
MATTSKRRLGRSITLRPIVLKFMGEGQPEAHDPYANNTFIDTRGLPAPAKATRPRTFFSRSRNYRSRSGRGSRSTATTRLSA